MEFPSQNIEKDKSTVKKMFDKIAPQYDFFNHFFSLGIDKLWRKKAVGLLKNTNPSNILDIATGTADFAIEAAKLHPEKIVGVDISGEMLKLARAKIEKQDLQHVITLQEADSESLPFKDKSFDAIICAFGVRNFENLNKGLSEMKRVLKPSGKIVVLEFTYPKNFPFKQLYDLYFNICIPFIGRIFSNDKSAYSYLPQSVKAFPKGKAFTDILDGIGFVNITYKNLTLGITKLYVAEKWKNN